MNFKFVTLNIWNGGRLLPAAREFLRSTQADLMFIQEVYNGHGSNLDERFKTAEILQADFPEFFNAFAAAYCDDRVKEGPIDDGQLILSRWPLEQLESIFLDVPYAKYDQDLLASTQRPTDFQNFPALIQKAVINLVGQPITLLNVHGPVNHQGTEDDDRRLHFSDLILQNLTSRTIVAGDFNVQRQTKTIGLLESKLTNVFSDELVTSFNVIQKDLTKFPGYATAAVDMILVTPAFRVVAHQCPSVNVSDHLPLVAEFDLPESEV